MNLRNYTNTLEGRVEFYVNKDISYVRNIPKATVYFSNESTT